jgi:hypothetical protein
MTAEPIRPPQPVSPPGNDPAAIRAALPPEDREHFDHFYRAALDEAKESFSLEPLTRLLRLWRGHALMAAQPGYAEAVEQAKGPLKGGMFLDDLIRERGR